MYRYPTHLNTSLAQAGDDVCERGGNSSHNCFPLESQYVHVSCKMKPSACQQQEWDAFPGRPCCSPSADQLHTTALLELGCSCIHLESTCGVVTSVWTGICICLTERSHTDARWGAAAGGINTCCWSHDSRWVAGGFHSVSLVLSQLNRFM